MPSEDGEFEAKETEALSREFAFQDKPVRSLVRDGTVWFIAADVCDVLEIKNPRQALVRLDDDEKGVISNDTLGGQQDVLIVNEFGLYRLALTSRKPHARTFQRWITHEVLPAIHRTGRYEAPASAPNGPAPSSDTADRISTEEDLPQPVQFKFSRPGRYTVTILPEGRHHAIWSDFDAVTEDHDGASHELLCHQVRIINLLWRQTRLIESLGQEAAGTFQMTAFEQAVSNANRSAENHLRARGKKPQPEEPQKIIHPRGRKVH